MCGEGLDGAGRGWKQAHVQGVRGQEPRLEAQVHPGAGARSSLSRHCFLTGGARTRSRRAVLGPPPLQQRPLERAPLCPEGDTLTAACPPSTQLPAPRCHQDPPGRNTDALSSSPQGKVSGVSCLCPPRGVASPGLSLFLPGKPAAEERAGRARVGGKCVCSQGSRPPSPLLEPCWEQGLGWKGSQALQGAGS